jgi:hypothetical protein
MAKPKHLAEVIFTLSRLCTSMLSLKLLPTGSDTFKHTLTLFVCGTAKIEFDLKFGKGGDLNGPATNFLLTQEARTSVTAGP